LREAPEGTYLSFNSDGSRYEVNASPNPSYEQPEAEDGNPNRQEDNTLRVAAASWIGNASVPDSEPERNLPQDKETESEKSSQHFSTNKESGDSDDLSTDRQRQEDKSWLDPPVPPYEFIEELEHSPGKAMTVEVDLHESYIRMVQHGANDEEWNLFCDAERRRLQHDKEQWEEWNEQQKTTEPPPYDTSEEEHPPPIPTDQSITLATPETTPPPTQKPPQKPSQTSQESSVITASRRSRRVKKETKKAQESEEWQRMKRRAYERAEKLTKKTIHSKRRFIPKQVLASFGVKYSTLNPDKKGTDTADDTLPLCPGNDLVPKKGISRKGKKRLKDTPEISGPWPQNNLEFYIATKLLESDPKYIPTSFTNPERYPPYSQLIYIPPEWRHEITPGNRTYAEDTSYPWIRRGELGAIRDWLTSLPGSQGKRFLAHSRNGTSITISQIFEPPDQTICRTLPERQRVLELKRDIDDGILYGHREHTVQCPANSEYLHNCHCLSHGQGTPVKIEFVNNTQPGPLEAYNADRLSHQESVLIQLDAQLRKETLPPYDSLYPHKKITRKGRRDLRNSFNGPSEIWIAARHPTTGLWHKASSMTKEERYIKYYPAPEEQNEGTSTPAPHETGWNITPGDQTYEEQQLYPWIERIEVEAIKEWLEKVPGSQGRCFLIHASNKTTIGVSVIKDHPRQVLGKKLTYACRIAEFQKDRKGILHGRRLHTATCAGTVNRNRLCQCTEYGLGNYLEIRLPLIERKLVNPLTNLHPATQQHQAKLRTETTTLNL
jgi:hypothetical protein